jgi:hypothetical protein
MLKEVKVLAVVAAAFALGACADSTSPFKEMSPGGADYLLSSQLALVPGPAGSAGTAISYPLYAGGGGSGPGTLVGNVKVWNTLAANIATFHVTYNITLAGACLTGTHLQIAKQVGNVPQKNGNPTPGQFSSKHDDACTTSDSYTVTFDLGADKGVVIAAHAGVIGVGAPVFPGADYASGTASITSTLTGRRSGTDGSGFTAMNQAVALANTPGTFWDDVISADPTGNGLALENAGAKWIWESAAPTAADAVVGSVIRVSAVISVPVATTGTLRITCDNGFRVDFNGSSITPSVNADATNDLVTSLSTGFAANIATATDLTQHNVNGDGWETVEAYPVNLALGTNTFTIYGVNEFMDITDHHTGFAGNGALHVGQREEKDDPHGTPTLNPAGCIYGIHANATPGSGEETAWGAPAGFSGATTGATDVGGNFGGSNWATWFAYKVRD